MSEMQARTTMEERHRSAALARRAATARRPRVASGDDGARVRASRWASLVAAVEAVASSTTHAILRTRPAAGDSR